MYAFCLSCLSATFALQDGSFVPREWLSCEEPIRLLCFLSLVLALCRSDLFLVELR